MTKELSLLLDGMDRDEKSVYGVGVYACTSAEDIEHFKSWIHSKMQKPIGDKLQEYIDIISKIDGMNYDALFFYSLGRMTTNNIYYSNNNLQHGRFIGNTSISATIVYLGMYTASYATTFMYSIRLVVVS